MHSSSAFFTFTSRTPLTYFGEHVNSYVCGHSCLHNDPRVEEKKRNKAHFPPVHEQPNLGKHVSVNLCHIAELRIPIVPLIESFHLLKAFKRTENILHPASAQTHLYLYACTRWSSAHIPAGSLCLNTYTRAWYRQIKNGSRVVWDHASSDSLGTFNIVRLVNHLCHVDGARYDVTLAATVVSIYHFERWLLWGKARLQS